MRLYSSPLSPYGARVSYSLAAKAIAHEVVKPSSLGGMTSPGFLAVAPMGKIPVLELPDGRRIPESDTIVEYLEEAYPAPALLPDDAFDRARARAIARFSDLYVINRLLLGGPGTVIPLGRMLPLSAARVPLARDSSALEGEVAALLHAFDNIARLIDPAGPFALGAKPGMADGALVPHLRFAHYAAELLAIPALSNHPLLAGYVPRAVAADQLLAQVWEALGTAMTTRRAEVEAAFGPIPTARSRS